MPALPHPRPPGGRTHTAPDGEKPMVKHGTRHTAHGTRHTAHGTRHTAHARVCAHLPHSGRLVGEGNVDGRALAHGLASLGPGHLDLHPVLVAPPEIDLSLLCPGSRRAVSRPEWWTITGMRFARVPETTALQSGPTARERMGTPKRAATWAGTGWLS
jgi:hypothetical protein